MQIAMNRTKQAQKGIIIQKIRISLW